MRIELVNCSTSHSTYEMELSRIAPFLSKTRLDIENHLFHSLQAIIASLDRIRYSNSHRIELPTYDSSFSWNKFGDSEKLVKYSISHWLEFYMCEIICSSFLYKINFNRVNPLFRLSQNGIHRVLLLLSLKHVPDLLMKWFASFFPK